MADAKDPRSIPPLPPGPITPPPPTRLAPDGSPKVKAAKVKVTSGGGRKTYRAHGKVFTSDPVEFDGSDEELDKLDADPNIVVERFDESGDLIHQDGSKLKKADLAPKDSRTGKKEEE